MKKITENADEALSQLHSVIQHVNNTSKLRDNNFYADSGIDSHIGRVISFYTELRKGVDDKNIVSYQFCQTNYYNSNLHIDSQSIFRIQRWLDKLPIREIKLSVRDELNFSNDSFSIVRSTLSRELLLMTERTIYHASYIYRIARQLGVYLPKDVGRSFLGGSKLKIESQKAA